MTATRGTFVLGSIGVKGAFPVMHRQESKAKGDSKVLCGFYSLPC